jgi:hypothetical protein
MLGNSDKNNKVTVNCEHRYYYMIVINILIISNIFFVQDIPKYDQVLSAFS